VSDPFGAADDSAMPFLRAALNPESAQRSLLKQLGDSGPARNLELHAIRVVRHKLGRRCLIEYDVIVRRPSGAEEAMTLIGKARARGVDDRAFRLTGELRTAGFNEESHDEIVVPEPIAIVPEFQMWLQRKVSGESLTALLPTRSGINLSRRVAHLIHKLQRTTVEPARIHTIAHELGILNQRLVLLIVDRPNWRARLERVMNACVTLASTLSASPPRLAHRDFHPDQVLVNGERVYVLDFDLCAKSDPALDAGNFVAHVSELSLRMTGDPQALADREHALEESLVARDPTISRSALRAYATLTLARHIHISTQFPERQPFTENILELCERRLNVSHRTPRRALQPSFQTEGVSHANSIL
jgi:hypothetical protein